MICDLCPRECHIERGDTNGGYCGVGMLPKIARIAPHYDEEPILSGTHGAGTIFFSGCSLRCVFCQNYTISSEDNGRYITPYALSEEYKRLESMGVHNIEFVTPTHYIDAILESLEIYRPKLPLIYNSSGYDRADSLRRLEGIIDVYLPDFKYSDNMLANRLSGCNNYVEIATTAITEMLRQTGEPIIEDGLIKRGVIIRHLVLPNHVKNSIGVLELITEWFGTHVPISLMSQYFPAGRAEEFPDINRRVTKREYQKVLDKLYELGLDGFAQDTESADIKYVPKWDY
ncbi:MAG: radical SAM protein [Ruminococcus sp.]|nr:radical SAM protein [Ruminococcus sp.]MBQ9516084.1 radical SAM protein [Ruminococcus sp.]